MTWVRYDDQAAIHRKVAVLDDATYRLWREAIEWCSRNLTDGRIAADELDVTSKRANPSRAAKLVDRGLWHTADELCGSEHCPLPGRDGWVIHDYWEYQPSREKVLTDLAAKAERTRKWRERIAAGKNRDGTRDASRDASSDTSVTLPPSPTPSPPRREAGTGVPEKVPAANHASGAAGTSQKHCTTCGNALNSAYHRNTCQRAQTA